MTVLGSATNGGTLDPSRAASGVTPNIVITKSGTTVVGKTGNAAAKPSTVGGATAPAAAPVVSRESPGPSNSDYVVVTAQGAALMGLGWAVWKFRGSAV